MAQTFVFFDLLLQLKNENVFSFFPSNRNMERISRLNSSPNTFSHGFHLPTELI